MLTLLAWLVALGLTVWILRNLADLFATILGILGCVLFYALGFGLAIGLFFLLVCGGH